MSALHICIGIVVDLISPYPTVPTPVVKLTSSMANPVLTGSSLNLTCTVKWMVAVAVPVDMQIVWTGADRSKLMSTSDPMMDSPSRYISRVVFDSVELAHSGEYTCTVHIGHQFILSAKKTITIGEHMILHAGHTHVSCCSHLNSYCKHLALERNVVSRTR